MDSPFIRQHIELVPLFRSLAAEALAQIAEATVYISLKRGESLFEQDSPATRFYYLVKGRIKLCFLAASGSEKVVEVFNSRSTIGQSLIFLEHPLHPVSASAMSASEVMCFDLARTLAIIRHSPDTLILFGADVSGYLVATMRELSGLSLHTGACRVAMYLVRQEANEDGSLHLDLPKKVLASRLSLKPESLSRILRDFSANGLITVDGRRITVREKGKLLALSDQCSDANSVSL